LFDLKPARRAVPSAELRSVRRPPPLSEVRLASGNALRMAGRECRPRDRGDALAAQRPPRAFTPRVAGSLDLLVGRRQWGRDEWRFSWSSVCPHASPLDGDDSVAAEYLDPAFRVAFEPSPKPIEVPEFRS